MSEAKNATNPSSKALHKSRKKILLDISSVTIKVPDLSVKKKPILPDLLGPGHRRCGFGL